MEEQGSGEQGAGSGEQGEFDVLSPNLKFLLPQFKIYE